MNAKNMRWPLVLVSFFLTLGLLLGGNYLYNLQQFNRPLENSYTEHPDILSYTIKNEKELVHIEIELKRVTNLDKTHLDIVQSTRAILGHSNFSLSIVDNSSEKLDRAWSKINFHIEKAVSDGDYPAAAVAIEDIASEHDIEVSFSVTPDYVYLAAYDEDHYLYKIRERNPQTGVNQQ